MAQYDLHLTQNIHASGVEFAEKVVNLLKGSLLSAVADGTPTVLTVGNLGQILEADPTSPTGLKWVNKDAGHTQNTDTGTTQQSFDLLSGGTGIKLKVNGGVLEVRNLADSLYLSFKGKEGSFDDVNITNAPSSNSHATNKSYVDGLVNSLLAANNAMVFKGTIGTGGTMTKAAFEALQTYQVGWTYRVVEKTTIRNQGCEIGDFFVALAPRSGSGSTDADWCVWQGNLDGVVVGPAASSDSYPALFDGATGKLLKQGSAPLGSAAYADAAGFASAAQGALADGAIQKTVLGANTIIYATTASTPVALTIGASTFVGRKATGNISAMSATEARVILNVADGATANTKATGAEIDTGTDDVKFATPYAIAQSKVVKGPVSSVANRIAVFSNTTGKLLADGGKVISDLKGNWVAAPASKTASGTAGEFAYDNNYFYLCVDSNIWARTPIARNW